MADDPQSFDRIVSGLLEGDPEVFRMFWEQYGHRLRLIAAQQLPRHMAHRADADDVVQSVCRSFFRRVRQGAYRFSEAEDLWRLLCAITVTKARQQVRFHLRMKRGVQHERAFTDDNESRAARHPAAVDQPVIEKLAFIEELKMALETLDEEERLVVHLKLEERTEQEIADRLKCSTRTVRRILKRARSRLRRLIEDD